MRALSVSGSLRPTNGLSLVALILGTGCGKLLGIGDLSMNETSSVAGHDGSIGGSGQAQHRDTTSGGFANRSSTQFDANTVAGGKNSDVPVGGNTSTTTGLGGAWSTQDAGGGRSPNPNTESAGTGAGTGKVLHIQGGGSGGTGAGGASAPSRAGAGGNIDPVRATTPSRPVTARCGGPWGFQDVETYDGTLGVPQWFVARHQLAVGTAAYGCSGTLISDDLFLSAGHCKYASGDLVWFNRQNGRNGAALPASAFVVVEIVEQEDNEDWDYAIVRLEGSPGREFGHAHISNRDPKPLGQVVIVQGAPKVVHVGATSETGSRLGEHWFSYDANTVEGAAGAGILNEDGELIGIHTDDGCKTESAAQANSGMRMSELGRYSQTIGAMLDSRVLWVYRDGTVSIWFADHNDGRRLRSTDINGLPGRIPLSFSGNKVLWKEPSGDVTLWMITSQTALSRIAKYGQDPDLTPINCANNRVLWRHADGRITLRRINDVGDLGESKDHQAPDGWQPVNYANNRILWRTAEGTYALSILDDEDEFRGKIVYDAPTGFRPINYANNEILWTDDAGSISLWSIARDGTPLNKAQPIPQNSGMIPVSYADRRVLWRNTDTLGTYASTWALNSAGKQLWVSDNYDYANWTAYFTSGGLP
ncbi:MAG: trypsin-like serine peptidase [Myxococcales bacterium]